MKRRVLVLCLVTVLMGIPGCAGLGNSSSPPLTATLAAGNWLFFVDSSFFTLPHLRNVPLRGALTTTGNTVTANLVTSSVIGAPCFSESLILSGSTSGNTVTLAPPVPVTKPPTPPDTSDLSITTTLQPASILLGTYTCTSVKAGLDSGTVYGTYIPPVSGTWTGTVPGVASNSNALPPPPTAMSASFLQSTTPVGTNNPIAIPQAFGLSGTVTLINPTCFPTGPAVLTIDQTQSYITGEHLVVYARSTDLLTSFSYVGGLDDPTAATTASLQSGFLYGNGNGICRFTFNGGIPAQVVPLKKS